MIKTVGEDDNIFERYSKVRILLKGVTVEAESNPERYILKKSHLGDGHVLGVRLGSRHSRYRR